MTSAVPSQSQALQSLAVDGFAEAPRSISSLAQALPSISVDSFAEAPMESFAAAAIIPSTVHLALQRRPSAEDGFDEAAIGSLSKVTTEKTSAAQLSTWAFE